MRIAEWDKNDYQLLDAANGERFENWGGYKLIRPDPTVLWKKDGWEEIHAKADGIFVRNKTVENGNKPKGGALGKDGDWIWKKKSFEKITISRKNLNFEIRPTNFKHTGIFPEQAANWDFYQEKIRDCAFKPKILNLFAYTGGASLACAGKNSLADVTNVDSVKNISEWAKLNAKISDIINIRFITEDAVKFVLREIRRGSKYDAIILDPPAFGRGTNGEIWKFEDDIFALLTLCSELLTEKPLFIALNSYVGGVSPTLSESLMTSVFTQKYLNFKICADEIGLQIKNNGLKLPCGNTCLIEF